MACPLLAKAYAISLVIQSVFRAMALKFELTPEAYVCLLGKVSKQSSAYVSLMKATPGHRAFAGAESSYYLIQCEERDAELFLTIGKYHCADTAPSIEEAIKTSHPMRR